MSINCIKHFIYCVVSLNFIPDTMDSRGWRMVTMALEKPNNFSGTFSNTKGMETSINNAKGLLKNENPFIQADKTEEDPFACEGEVSGEEYDDYNSQMCRNVANILNPKKRLKDYDGEDIDAFLPKQCCSSNESYRKENDFSAVDAIINEEEDLGVIYSDVSNILKTYDSIQNSEREEKGEHLDIDMQVKRLTVPMFHTVTVNDDERTEAMPCNVKESSPICDGSLKKGNHHGEGKIRENKSPRIHTVLEPCQCRKWCYEDIDDARRIRINEQFSYERQGDWLIQVVIPVKDKKTG